MPQWTNRAQISAHIAAGPAGVFVATKQGIGNGRLKKWEGGAWVPLPEAAAVVVAAGPAGVVWCVNDEGHMYRQRADGTWEPIGGRARVAGVTTIIDDLPGQGLVASPYLRTLSIGADGSVFHIGTTPSIGGFGIFRWNGGGWDPYPGAGVAVAVGPDGSPWHINSDRQIFRWTGGWTPVPGQAIDISVGADGSVYHVGTTPSLNGWQMFKWNGGGWDDPLPGAGASIAVAANGTPWHINRDFSVFEFV
jgi:hypothetical protein